MASPGVRAEYLAASSRTGRWKESEAGFRALNPMGKSCPESTTRDSRGQRAAKTATRTMLRKAPTGTDISQMVL
jgi:hypothetical protein